MAYSESALRYGLDAYGFRADSAGLWQRGRGIQVARPLEITGGRLVARDGRGGARPVPRALESAVARVGARLVAKRS